MTVRRSPLRAFVALAGASTLMMFYCWTSMISPQIEQENIDTHFIVWDSARLNDGKPLVPRWNNTGNPRVFYNRVPKCASRSVGAVLNMMVPTLSYPMVSSQLFWPLHLKTDKQRELVKYVNDLPEISIYNRHLHFIDFTKYGELQPVYFNIIREPVERAISNYYFQNEINNWTMSLDECVSKGLERCLGEENTYFVTPFFCGHQSSCRRNSMWSLQMAQRNVEIHYAFVGLTEALPECFRLAESLLPQYFQGAGEIYTEIAKKEWKDTRTSRKRTVSNATRATLAEHMQVDIAFYQWTQKHFYQLYTKHVSDSPAPIEIS